MSSIIKITAVAVSLALASSVGAVAQTGSTGAQKMSQAQCQTLWNSADSGKSGSLTESQAKTYVSDFKSVDTNKDGRLSSAEFMSGCERGQVRGTASTGTGAGTTGTGKTNGAGK